MKQGIKYLFTILEEEPGALSSSRVMYVVGSLYSMGMGAWVFYVSEKWEALIAVVPALAGVFVVQKIVQKGQEK